MARKVDPEVIEAKNAERGWRVADLAEAACISVPTAYRAAKGEPVSTITINKIVIAYARHKPKAGHRELLGKSTEAAS